MNGLPPKKNSVRCESVEHKKETNYSLVTFNKNRVAYRGLDSLNVWFEAGLSTFYIVQDTYKVINGLFFWLI